MSLSRLDIFAAKLKQDEVNVPEWGGVVKVRVLNVAERLALEADVKADRRNAVQIIAIAGACDDDGKLLFTADDIVLLQQTSSTAMLAVCEAVKKINGLSQEDVEQSAKNSDASPPANLPLGSQHILG